MLANLKYQLGDYLGYSWQTWLAVQAEYNAAIYPLQFFGLIAGAVIFGTLLAGARSRYLPGLALAITGLAWGFIGATLFRQYLSVIDWTATTTAWIFVAQGLLLLISALLIPATCSPLRPAIKTVALVTATLALSGYPLLQWLLGQQVTQLDWYGTGPVCTVLMTTAIVLTLPRAFGWLLVIPWLWSLRVFSVSWPLGDRAGMLVLPWLTMCIVIAVLATQRMEPR